MQFNSIKFLLHNSFDSSVHEPWYLGHCKWEHAVNNKKIYENLNTILILYGFEF